MTEPKFKRDDSVRVKDEPYITGRCRVVQSRVVRGAIFYDLKVLTRITIFDGAYEPQLYLDPLYNSAVMRAIRGEK